ncbi:MAG: LacI family DNA-binding transcriptional regulator [Nakamurella sp.]
MARPRARLMDVAALAGVSRTTASFVLTGRRDMRISSDAEQRVMQAARELDYRPNLLARSLRTNLSQTIGLISDVVATEPFAGHLIRSSMTTALLHEHLLFVGESGGDQEVEQQLVRSMLDRGVGGFLYASSFTRVAQLSPLLMAQRVVMLNCLPSIGEAVAVVPDEEAGGRLAAATLLEAGHRDGIVLVGETPDHVVAGVERRRGIEKVLSAAGTALAGDLPTRWWPGAAYAATARLLADGTRPTAFICINDRVAFGVHQALTEVGVAVPEQVSLISFDDSDLAAWMRPGLTSVAIPHREMGRRATELLLAPAGTPTVHRIEMPLVRRDSVGPAR